MAQIKTKINIGCKLNEDDKVELKSLELYVDKNILGADEYYLKAVYERTTKYVKERWTIPKIRLGVNPYSMIINHITAFNPCATVNIGFGDLPIFEEDKCSYIVDVLEYYPQKMTLEEIEKKLGYKVEIVSNK